MRKQLCPATSPASCMTSARRCRILCYVVCKRSSDCRNVHAYHSKAELPHEVQISHADLSGAWDRYCEFAKTQVAQQYAEQRGTCKKYFSRALRKVLTELDIRAVKNYGVTGDCPTCLRIDLLRSKAKRTAEEDRELAELQRGKSCAWLWLAVYLATPVAHCPFALVPSPALVC